MRKTFRLFGIPVWSVEDDSPELEEEELAEGDHQGGDFSFGFGPPDPTFDAGLRSAGGWDANDFEE